MGIPDGAGGKNTAFLETDEAMEPGVGPLWKCLKMKNGAKDNSRP